VKDYRIKKVDEGRVSVYYVQRRFLWFWWDIYVNGFKYFYELEHAKKELHIKVYKSNVEYIYNID
jgi:hypothetical protein